MQNKITVIILNYRKYQDTREAILSVKNQILPPEYIVSILLIDNGSKDESTKKIEKEFPELSYIYNQDNVGFALGVNQGMKLAWASDYFLLLNDDAKLSPDCISELLKASTADNICGPAIYYTSRPDIVWQGGGYFNKYKLGIDVPEKNKKAATDKTQEVDFISGCVMLIPKKVVERVGFFDGKFFVYGEDLDFCLRALKNGIKIKYVPSTSAWHNIGNIMKNRTSSFVLKNLAISYFLIIRKHFPTLKIYGLILFIFIYTPFRLWQIIRGGNNIKNIFAWLKGGKIGWQTKL